MANRALQPAEKLVAQVLHPVAENGLVLRLPGLVGAARNNIAAVRVDGTAAMRKREREGDSGWVEGGKHTRR